MDGLYISEERIRVGGWMDGWMGGCIERWMDGWMDGWIAKPDSKTKLFFFLY